MGERDDGPKGWWVSSKKRQLPHLVISGRNLVVIFWFRGMCAIKFTEHGEVVLRAELQAQSDDKATMHFAVTGSMRAALMVRRTIDSAEKEATAEANARRPATLQSFIFDPLEVAAGYA